MGGLARAAGRTAFGADSANYHAARPAYPDWVFDILGRRCGLRPGAAVFEVGAGTGTASDRLLAMGASPLVAIEPDARMAGHLTARLNSPRLRICVQAFEEAVLPPGAFDLGVAATSFHWVEPERGQAQAFRLLRPGGWWAMVWNVFGDESRPDPFHEATAELLGGEASPSFGAPGGPPFALDAVRRRTELEAAGFSEIGFEARPWTLVLDPAAVRALYGTYSDINQQEPDDRERLLDALAEIAARQFGGRVERNMITALHLARRPVAAEAPPGA